MTAARVSHLRPVPDAPAEERVAFCSHCGETPRPSRQGSSRVCTRCELGLILHASGSAAPAPEEPFVVCDEGGLICALSEAAERVLAVSEPAVIHRPLSDLLSSAAHEERISGSLAQLVGQAARGDEEVRHVVVSPQDTFGVRFRARVSTCGPPAAAVVTLSDSV